MIICICSNANKIVSFYSLDMTYALVSCIIYMYQNMNFRFIFLSPAVFVKRGSYRSFSIQG